MALLLNDPVATYKEFCGRYNAQMPALIREGRTPLTVADIMRRRVDVAHRIPELRDTWMNHYFDTSDAVFYHPNGKMKIVRHAAALTAITRESSMHRGALDIDEATYRAADGPEFTRHRLLVETPLTPEQARNHPIWRALAANDQTLLDEYTNLVFSAAADYTCMSVRLRAPMATPSVRAWAIGDMLNRWNVAGNASLDSYDDFTRLVGVTRAAHHERRE